MVYGNKIAKQIIDNIQKGIKENKIDSGFFLITGPKNIGKKTLIKELIEKIGVEKQDLLFLEDPGKEDGKLYLIKVEEQEHLLEVGGKKYLTMGVREIVDYISKTPVGKYKIVFIENIERMNLNAANAMLKNLEEPPKHTFIFATSSNKGKLLDTIISRATVINMFELSKDDFKTFLEENMIILDENKFNVLYAVSGGRIGLAKKLLEGNNDLLEKVEEFIQLEEKNVEKLHRFNIFKDLINEGKINLFLDALIFYYTHTNEFEKVQKLIDIKIKNQANVNLENLVFEYLL